MKYNTIAINFLIGFIGLNNACNAYAIPYNTCKYCVMFNKHMPVYLRNSNILTEHKLRPNSANYGSSASSGSSDSSYNDLNALNDINQINELYIPFPFNTPNVSKIANTSNTTQLSNTTDTTSNIDSCIDRLYFNYTLGAIIIIINKFYGYYRLF